MNKRVAKDAREQRAFLLLGIAEQHEAGERDLRSARAAATAPESGLWHRQQQRAAQDCMI